MFVFQWPFLLGTDDLFILGFRLLVRYRWHPIQKNHFFLIYPLLYPCITGNSASDLSRKLTYIENFLGQAICLNGLKCGCYIIKPYVQF